jgi:hypothetical protein
LWSLGAMTALMILLRVSPTAREVVGESALTIFQILTAPFVLETCLAIAGLCIVMAINHYRQQKEGDGWVYLQRQEPQPGVDDGAGDPPHRHDAVLWHEKPGAFDEVTTEFEVIEGYVDLGLADDALQELAALPQSMRQKEQACDLFVRALVISGRLPEAAGEFEKSAKDHPERSERLAGTALSVACWLNNNRKAETEIDEWLLKSRRVDARAFDKLPADHALKARADK